MKNPSSGVAKILRRGTNLIENNNYHYVILLYHTVSAEPMSQNTQNSLHYTF